jgi:hypothetical protein
MNLNPLLLKYILILFISYLFIDLQIKSPIPTTTHVEKKTLGFM